MAHTILVSPKLLAQSFIKTNIVDACGRCHKVEKEKVLSCLLTDNGIKEGY